MSGIKLVRNKGKKETSAGDGRSFYFNEIVPTVSALLFYHKKPGSPLTFVGL